jgi:hypothetical protein
MHAFRRRGRPHPQILYWFRGPVDVKVGRAPLDEDAISLLEERHPEVAFDWPKILEPSAPGLAATGRRSRKEGSAPRAGAEARGRKRESAGRAEKPAKAKVPGEAQASPLDHVRALDAEAGEEAASGKTAGAGQALAGAATAGQQAPAVQPPPERGAPGEARPEDETAAQAGAEAAGAQPADRGEAGPGGQKRRGRRRRGRRGSGARSAARRAEESGVPEQGMLAFPEAEAPEDETETYGAAEELAGLASSEGEPPGPAAPEGRVGQLGSEEPAVVVTDELGTTFEQVPALSSLVAEEGEAEPDVPVRHPIAAEQRFSPEDLARLRGRHAAILARIDRMVKDPERAGELRARAEVLDPDTWVTPEDMAQALEGYERNYREIRRLLGRPRPRRRRSGATDEVRE